MAPGISVVIICRNEEHIIGRTLESVQHVADEIIVYDTGSIDNTVDIARQMPKTKILIRPWEGYGKTKQKAVAVASNAWVLNIDADEVLDDVLQKGIASLSLADANLAYRVRFKNFLGKKYFRWGEFGSDSHIRLFNKSKITWNDKDVHEQLVLPTDVKVITAPGHILHYTMRDTKEFVQKSVNYAMINAENYFQQGRGAGIIRQLVSPAFTFVKNYIFKLGFLDGWNGLFAARMSALYSYLKYTRLRELWENANLESRNAKGK